MPQVGAYRIIIITEIDAFSNFGLEELAQLQVTQRAEYCAVHKQRFLQHVLQTEV